MAMSFSSISIGRIFLTDVRPYRHHHHHRYRFLPIPTQFNRKKRGSTVGLLDCVTGPQTNPLRDGTVLSLSFGKLLLGTETLVAL